MPAATTREENSSSHFDGSQHHSGRKSPLKPRLRGRPAEAVPHSAFAKGPLDARSVFRPREEEHGRAGGLETKLRGRLLAAAPHSCGPASRGSSGLPCASTMMRGNWRNGVRVGGPSTSRAQHLLWPPGPAAYLQGVDTECVRASSSARELDTCWNTGAARPPRYHSP